MGRRKRKGGGDRGEEEEEEEEGKEEEEEEERGRRAPAAIGGATPLIVASARTRSLDNTSNFNNARSTHLGRTRAARPQLHRLRAQFAAKRSEIRLHPPAAIRLAVHTAA